MLMSVSEALTTAVTSASTQLEATTAPVLMDIDCLGMDCPVKVCTHNLFLQVLLLVCIAHSMHVLTFVCMYCVWASSNQLFANYIHMQHPYLCTYGLYLCIHVCYLSIMYIRMYIHTCIFMYVCTYVRICI